ncbi:MAG: hypothetical protein M0Z36_04230 [Thermaerobacter sp.]|nr:hypothetical protein [Thermaerobacter sp.]
MATIVANRSPRHERASLPVPNGRIVRKLGQGDSGKGPSRVKTETVYLGTADHIRDLVLVEAVNRRVPKRRPGLSPGTYIALGVLAVLAKLCAPETGW